MTQEWQVRISCKNWEAHPKTRVSLRSAGKLGGGEQNEDRARSEVDQANVYG